VGVGPQTTKIDALVYMWSWHVISIQLLWRTYRKS